MREICKLALGALAIVVLLARGSAYAATNATATMTEEQIGSNAWKYSFTLTNTGNTTINTFWSAWVVYAGFYVYDLLPTNPTNVSFPAGWNGSSLNDSPLYSPGKYGVEWVSGAGLAPGQSLSGFSFTTADDPTVIEGTGILGYPVRESWVYHGGSQTEPGAEFTPTIVPLPEPASATLLTPAILLAARKRRSIKL